MLDERIKKNYTLAERKKIRQEEEEKRLEDIYKQRKIKEEFFNVKFNVKDKDDEEKIDLKNLGFKSAADFDPNHISSRFALNLTFFIKFRPENLLATSQRMMESTSIMEMKNKEEDEEVSDTEPQTTQVGFKPLVNSADDINAEESKTEKNSEGIG